MPKPSPIKAHRRLLKNYSAIFVVLVSATAIVGRALGLNFVENVIPGISGMEASTAIGLMFTAWSLLLFRKGAAQWRIAVARTLSVAVLVIGAVTAFEYAAGLDLGIDSLLVRNAGAVDAVRMAPPSALCFIFFGTATLALSLRRPFRVVCDPLAIVTMSIAFGAVLAHLYVSQWVYGLSRFSNMSFPTAITFAVAGFAVLMANRDSKLTSLVLSDTLGGVMARRLLPAAIAIPVAAGWVRMKGQDRGFYDTGFSTALGIFVSVWLTILLIYFFARAVHRSESRRRAAELRLQENEKRYRLLVDNGQGSISTHTLEGVLTSINPAGARVLGYTEDEMVGRHLNELIPENFHPALSAYLRQIAHEGLSNGLLSMTHRSGEVLTFRFHNVVITEDDKPPYVLCHAQNVTELLAAQQKLKDLSLTDELTGLHNRRGFLTMAEHQLKLENHRGTARGLVLLFADMDGLKEINDTYGHQAGSKAIVTLGRLISSAVRSADLVARWGGDEFVILSVGAQAEDGKLMIERIQESIGEHNAESPEPYLISCSIGMAQVDNTRGLDEVIAEADARMYAEKKRRKADLDDPGTPPHQLVHTSENGSLSRY